MSLVRVNLSTKHRGECQVRSALARSGVSRPDALFTTHIHMVDSTTRMPLKLKEGRVAWSDDSIHTVLVRAKRADLRTSTAGVEDFSVIDATYVTEDAHEDAQEGKKEQHITLMARCVPTRVVHPPLGIDGLKLYEFDNAREYLGALRVFYEDCPHTHADLVVDIAGTELVLRVPLPAEEAI